MTNTATTILCLLLFFFGQKRPECEPILKRTEPGFSCAFYLWKWKFIDLFGFWLIVNWLSVCKSLLHFVSVFLFLALCVDSLIQFYWCSVDYWLTITGNSNDSSEMAKIKNPWIFFFSSLFRSHSHFCFVNYFAFYFTLDRIKCEESKGFRRKTPTITTQKQKEAKTKKEKEVEAITNQISTY